METINNNETEKQFTQLIEILKKLRGPNGCPWDKEQTHESLINYLREESFEVIESITKNDDDNFCEELGDLILQIALHSVIAEERKAFTIKDVLNKINSKLIYRHPHVFDNNHVQEFPLDEQWEKLKKNEKQKDKKECSFKISDKITPWLNSERIQMIAENDKFDWENPNDIIDKIIEECNELKEAILLNDKKQIKEEIGDILFSVLNIPRFFKMNTEKLLISANKKFIERYELMIKLAKEAKPEIRFKKLLLSDKEIFWQTAKNILKNETKNL